ncbi:MAG: DUF72 domain-containing protein [Polyangiaceae bacterium]
MRAWVGTSGWQYASWKGTFYPPRLPQREWLSYYGTAFPIVEVNNSFYRMPEGSTFERWREATPPDFVFAVKANRLITHLHRLRGTQGALSRFWSRAQGLKKKLGPVLFQLPPSFKVDVPRLADFLATLPVPIRAAFELRHPSWVRDDVLDLLDRAGAAWVLADRAGARVPTLVTGGWCYVRFHQGQAQKPGYTHKKLARWADRLAGLDVETFAFFNNDMEVAAPADALTFTELLRERGCEVPPPRAPRPAPGPTQLRLFPA